MANQNIKRPENITLGHALAFTYLSFAYTTDGELSKNEMATITSLVNEWYPEGGGQDAQKAIIEAFEWVSSCDEIFTELVPVLDIIQENYEDEQLKAVLQDIYAIAKADGKVTENEQGQLAVIADKFGFELN